MKKISGKLPDNVVYVPVDFRKQSPDVKLKNVGHNLTFRTFSIREAVTQFTPKEATGNTLKYTGEAAPGIKLVFSYVIKSFFDGQYSNDGVKTLAKQLLKKNNHLFKTGFDPTDMKDYLSKYSLTLIEDVDSVEMQERYSKLVDLYSLKTVKEFELSDLSWPRKKANREKGVVV